MKYGTVIISEGIKYTYDWIAGQINQSQKRA